MKKYPFTYAVFYRSIIEPQTLLRQYEINNALFSGDTNLDHSHPDFISPVIGNGYVSGNKTIRSELIQKVQNMPAEKLVSHIKLLHLQDISTVILTIRKLLSIVDIGDSLRNRLLEKADTVNEELFIAEIFQQSLKYHNKKLKLSNEDKSFLNNLSDYDVKEQDIQEDENNINAEPVEDITKNETPIDDTSSSTSSSKSKFSSIYDEIDHIVEEVRNNSFYSSELEVDSARWKRIRLPDDFNQLISSIAPLLIEEPYFIQVDLADVISVCHLDLETKTCGDGHIEVLTVSCPKDDTSMYTNALKQIKNCSNALFHISGDVDLIDVENLTHDLHEHLEPDANIVWGVSLDTNIYDRYVIQVICYINDSTEEDPVISPDDIQKTIDSYMDSIVVDKPKEKQKEIDIPYFLRK